MEVMKRLTEKASWLDGLPVLGERREQKRLEGEVLVKILLDLAKGYTRISMGYGSGMGQRWEKQFQTVILQGRFDPFWVGLTIYESSLFDVPESNVLDLQIATNIDDGIRNTIFYQKSVDLVEPKNSDSSLNYYQSRVSRPYPRVYFSTALSTPSIKEKIAFLREILLANVDTEKTKIEYEKDDSRLKNKSEDSNLVSAYWNSTPQAAYLTSISTN